MNTVTLAQQANSLTIEDVARIANEIAQQHGEYAKDEYLTCLFNALHK